MKLVIGTRGSQLALWQAEYVSDLLQQAGVETLIKIIDTKGDQILNRPLSEIGSKGLFTEELELELKEGTIDLAVHSAKDMPSSLPEELELIAFSVREKINDVVLSLDKTFTLEKAVQEKWLVGTSSTRRRATLYHYYPGIELVDMRGNLQTRLQKLKDGTCRAMLLAYAGVHRMNMEEYIVQELPVEQFTPAVGQGCLAIETAKSLSEDKKTLIKKVLNHAETESCMLAERAFLKTMEGGCSVPVFAIARLENKSITLKGGVISLDGQQCIREEIKGNVEDALQLGESLAQKVIALGGQEILKAIKKGK
jgi:hydroxymethylbilane synthase